MTSSHPSHFIGDSCPGGHIQDEFCDSCHLRWTEHTPEERRSCEADMRADLEGM